LEKDNIFWVGVGGFSTHDAIPNVLQHAQIFCSSPEFCLQQQTEVISVVTSAASVLKKQIGCFVCSSDKGNSEYTSQSMHEQS